MPSPEPPTTCPWRPRPRLASQHAVAGSDESHANATCWLLSDQALGAKASAPHGPCLGAQPLSPRLSALPGCWLRPPATTRTQRFRTLNKVKRTCGAMSSSRYPLPPVLPSLKVICTRPPRAASRFCWTLQVPSSLASEPATKFTATSLLVKPNENLLVSFHLPFR